MSDDPLEGVTFCATEPEALPCSAVREALEPFGVVRLRGLFDRDQLRVARERIAARFDPGLDRKHDPSDTEAVRGNLQKLRAGGIDGADPRHAVGRLMRVLYNPIFADDVWGMRQHFVKLARVRNRVCGLPLDFAVSGTERGLWTAARIHQYPRGGGFMAPHRDRYGRAPAEEAGFDFLQVFLLLSERGRDYTEGGGFVVRDDAYLFYEQRCQIGDVIVYDARVLHGVADIDPLQPLDLASFSGRVAAFVSLYAQLASGGRDYAELRRRASRRYASGVES